MRKEEASWIQDTANPPQADGLSTEGPLNLILERCGCELLKTCDSRVALLMDEKVGCGRETHGLNIFTNPRHHERISF